MDYRQNDGLLFSRSYDDAPLIRPADLTNKNRDAPPTSSLLGVH